VLEQSRRDLRMIGSTTSLGGTFRLVKLTGESVLEGDVDCIKLASTGELKINGGLRSEVFRFTGETDIAGRLDSRKIGGRGELRVQSSIRGVLIKFTGNIEVKGDCELESLNLSGGINVEGLLSAESLELSMYGSCRAREIGGGTIKIKKSKPAMLTNIVRSKSLASLSADAIEGDILMLEHTTAGVVRGRRVSIGAGCEIARVEYSDSLDVHKNASVKETIHL
jgi:cytoskeletal protein CcmA (bactofilin family)